MTRVPAQLTFRENLMLILELLFVGMLLLRVVGWFARALLRLHVALIVLALPAGLLVRAGVIEDVGSFSVVSCAWAAVLLTAWAAGTRKREAAAEAPAARRGPGRLDARPAAV
jgi:hypothetical protein